MCGPQDLAGTVHGNEIGRAIAFAVTTTIPPFCRVTSADHRVFRQPASKSGREFDKLGLIDIDHDGVSRELGERGHGHKRIPSTNAGNPKDARMRVRRELNDIPYPGAFDRPARAIRSGTGRRHGKSDRN